MRRSPAWTLSRVPLLKGKECCRFLSARGALGWSVANLDELLEDGPDFNVGEDIVGEWDMK